MILPIRLTLIKEFDSKAADLFSEDGLREVFLNVENGPKRVNSAYFGRKRGSFISFGVRQGVDQGVGMVDAIRRAMKTFYIIKSFLPFICLPIAPGVLQVELQRQGLLTSNSSALIAVLLQIVFTLGIVIWITRAVKRDTEEKAYLKMSCVSKKVFHEGEWMTVERYLADRHNIVVSHGMTPEESTEWLKDAREWVRTQAANDLNPQAYRTAWSDEGDLAEVSASPNVG